ncbi:unnamed protein product [Ceratitis capitata]|uniref:(Mediterranean fruit fly) hypothetical protein n=1 Tax=Ceratitis capitata TaxID=7213 RepID=A0A811UP73_CERCA|nr:unnamed protein product [Ceratitis capitata]
MPNAIVATVNSQQLCICNNNNSNSKESYENELKNAAGGVRQLVSQLGVERQTNRKHIVTNTCISALKIYVRMYMLTCIMQCCTLHYANLLLTCATQLTIGLSIVRHSACMCICIVGNKFACLCRIAHSFSG